MRQPYPLKRITELSQFYRVLPRSLRSFARSVRFALILWRDWCVVNEHRNRIPKRVYVQTDLSESDLRSLFSLSLSLTHFLSISLSFSLLTLFSLSSRYCTCVRRVGTNKIYNFVLSPFVTKSRA